MVKSKNMQIIPEMHTFWPKYFLHCSWITVVHVHVKFLSKTHPACHNDTNGIKAGSNSKMTDRQAAESSQAAYLGLY